MKLCSSDNHYITAPLNHATTTPRHHSFTNKMVIGLTMVNILNSSMYLMIKEAKKMYFLRLMKGTALLPKRKTNLKNKELFQKFKYSFRIFHIYYH